MGCFELYSSFIGPCLLGAGLSVGLGACAHQAKTSASQEPAREPVADLYSGFRELSQHETRGVDFDIQVADRQSPYSVMAVHGGQIEPYSDVLGQMIAGDEFNLYVFKSLKKRNHRDLHLTSTHFDEPSAIGLASKSKDCVSVHSHMDDATSRLCIGGSNKKLASALATGLAERGYGFEIEFPCKRLPGTSKTNIVNRCQRGGVQLEFSTLLMQQLETADELSHRLATDIRQLVISNTRN